jgi:hypothetical protein
VIPGLEKCDELPRPEAPPPKGGFLGITPALSNEPPRGKPLCHEINSYKKTTIQIIPKERSIQTIFLLLG